MTLIIGCIGQSYGVIAGDTQLTRKGLNRNGKSDKCIELKTSNYGTDFLMGILGDWVSWIKNDENPSHYKNEYDNLKSGLQKFGKKDKQSIVEEFLEKRKHLDASSIFINRNTDDFQINSKSSKPTDVIKEYNHNNCKFIFNEPYSDIDNKYVLDFIQSISEEYKLESKLEHSLFLMNNAILNLICKGNEVDIRGQENNINCLGIDNTVGGYVTIQIMTKDNLNVSDLSKCYSYDHNCLNDGLTYAFAKKLNSKKYIKYIDNLGMIIKSINYPFNTHIKRHLIEFVQMQLLYISKEKILNPCDLNKIIEFVNKKYDLNLNQLKIKKNNDDDDQWLLLDEEAIVIDINYLLNFFKY